MMSILEDRRRRSRKKKLAKELRAQATKPRAETSGPKPIVVPARGFAGASRGESRVAVPQTFVGTSSQVCGLWLWSVGATAPAVGAPLGPHLETGAMVCGDPLSYFQRLGNISNPSQFVLALPGVGKSSLVRRQCTAMDAFGVINLILGDIKPDYVVMVKQLGGDTVSVGPGRESLNVLDDGDVATALRALHAAAADAREMADAAAAAVDDAPTHDELEALAGLVVATRGWAGRRAEVVRALLDGSDEDRGGLLREFVRDREVYAEETDRSARALAADAHERKVTLLSAIVALQRQDAVADWEETVLDEAVTILEETFHERTPEVGDVLQLIVDAPERIRTIVLDDGTDESYRAATRRIQQALQGLVRGGRFGRIFAGQSTVRIRRDRPLAIDVSSIPDNNRELQAAVLMTCWSMGFAAVNVSHALSDAGLEQPRIYHIVMDELHRALRTGTGMVDRLDMLTRVNRTDGVALTQITHTMKDLESMRDPEDKEKARGFVERAGMVVLGGLPAGEMPKLAGAGLRLSRREQDMLARWSDGAPVDSHTGKAGAMPGRGKFMIKIGGSPAIPFGLHFTATEKAADVHDTNQRWHLESRHSARVVEEEVLS